MDIRTAYDWSRVIDWLDSDITTYTIKNAIGFLVVWWFAQGWFREGTAEVARAKGRVNAASTRAIASVMAPGCALARRMAAIDDAEKGTLTGCPCATANVNTISPYTRCANQLA